MRKYNFMESYILAIVLISLLLATLGHGKKIGFWNAFFLSVITSPVVAILVVLLSAEKDPVPDK